MLLSSPKVIPRCHHKLAQQYYLTRLIGLCCNQHKINHQNLKESIKKMHSQEKLLKTKPQNSEWIFWVTHIYTESIRTHSYSTFYKCIVTKEQISIENHPSIRISKIQECDHALITRFRSIHTKLLLKDGKTIEIAVADPYFPNFRNRQNASEAWVFKEIINALIAGKQPDHLKNPYHRVKNKAKFYPEDVEYDAHVSPLNYYHRYRKRWSALEIIIRVNDKCDRFDTFVFVCCLDGSILWRLKDVLSAAH